MSNNSGIHIQKSHEGLFHHETGVPEGHKIPLADIKREEHSSDPKVRKEAQFADNARHFNHHHGK